MNDEKDIGFLYDRKAGFVTLWEESAVLGPDRCSLWILSMVKSSTGVVHMDLPSDFGSLKMPSGKKLVLLVSSLFLLPIIMGIPLNDRATGRPGEREML